MKKVYYITANIAGALGACGITYLSSSLFPSKKAAEKALKDSMPDKKDKYTLWNVSWQWDNKEGIAEIHKLPLIPIN